MRVPGLLVTAGLLFASLPADATPVIAIEGFQTGISFSCDITLAPFVLQHARIVAYTRPEDPPIHGMEFAIQGLPATVVLTVTPNPIATAIQGGPFSPAGARIVLPECTAGQRIVLYDVDLLPLAPTVPFTLHVTAHPQPTVPNTQCPAAFLCDNTVACAVGGLNALGPYGAAPSPTDHAADVPLDALLQFVFAVGFPCGCIPSVVLTTLYFGTDPNPPVLASGDLPFPFDPGTLEPHTTYYWRITRGFCGAVFDSPVWSFTTGAALGVQAHPWSYIKNLYR